MYVLLLLFPAPMKLTTMLFLRLNIQSMSSLLVSSIKTGFRVTVGGHDGHQIIVAEKKPILTMDIT